MADVRLVFLGAPGSGKGTQAARVSEGLGVPAISTGEMLRDAVAAGSELGERVEQIMAAGALVDDATMAEVIRGRLAQDDTKNGFLLDGYPRTIGQVAILEQILGELGATLTAVVLIDVREEELVRRALERRRDDDTEEVIRTRLDVYREKTEPLVEYYRTKGLLREVDGNESIEEVTAALMGVLPVSA